MSNNNNIDNKCWNQYQTKFMIDEINLYISWNSNKATQLLISLMKLFNTPHTLNLNQNGLAHFIKYNIKNMVYYDYPVIWSEIMVCDEYIYDEDNKVANLNPLYCHYNIELSSQHIDKIAPLNKFGIHYDINKKTICINCHNFLDTHYKLKIVFDILKNNNIEINKFITYFKSMKIKYKTKKNISILLYKIHSFQL